MCDEREPLLAYLYDEVEPVERRRVEAHLATCERCRDELAGLRGVREDLLAWDVPPHESVWKPFVPVRASWSWRDVPAWSLAAAALVMLSLGAAGGVATSAWLSHGAPVLLTAQAPSLAPSGLMVAGLGSRTPVAAVTPADLAAFEQRLLDESARRNQAVATRVGLSSTDYDQLIQISVEQQQALGVMTKRINDLGTRVSELSAALAAAQAQQGGR